jgi:DNA-binding response OmpR family regulator
MSPCWGLQPITMCSTILLLDDDPVQAATRKAILASAGYTVVVVKDPREALSILDDSNSQIGFVITDHFMPGMNGPQFVSELRKKDPSMPVLVLSGMPGVEPEYNGLDVMHRVKPFAPTDLILLTQTILGSRQHLSRTA